MSYLLLLGVSDDRLANSLHAQLGELPDMQVADVESSSGDVAGALGQHPDVEVLLLHEEIGPLPALQLIRDICLRHPQLAVVLIAEKATPETFSAAMDAGARAVVSSRPTQEELRTRIGSAAEWSRSMRRHLQASSGGPVPGPAGALIAITGAKGGTGTTTLAVHLALAASAARRTVCLVDMDLQGGDVPGYLDIAHRRSIADLVDAADDLNPTVLADTLFVHPAGPHVLLAPAQGERAEEVHARAARQILGSLRSRYEVVIADCGAHMTEASAMAVEMADRVLVTTTPDLPALRATRRLAKLWSRLQVRKEDDLEVVLNRTSRHNEIQPDFARKVTQLPMLRTGVPAAFRTLESAANTGIPTSVDDGNFRKAIGSLAVEAGLLEGQASRQAQGASTARGRKRRRGSGDEGQTTMEFTALVPLALFVLLLMWEVTLVGFSAVFASHAANEGARAAAVHQSPREVREAALSRMPQAWAEDAKVIYGWNDEYVAVKIRTPVVVPGLAGPWKVAAESKVVYEP